MFPIDLAINTANEMLRWGIIETSICFGGVSVFLLGCLLLVRKYEEGKTERNVISVLCFLFWLLVVTLAVNTYLKIHLTPLAYIAEKLTK